MQKQKVELLAPAGSREKFYTAINFGADAVYLSGKQYGLRAFADNFTIEEIVECCSYAHSLGRKVYVTINIYAFNNDFDNLADYIRQLDNANVDAVICADVGVVSFITSLNPKLSIHLSTQANTTNKHAVNFWHKQGINRVVLARECKLSDIKEIAQFNKDVEIECFVHGAMCISYSGRCLMSNYLTNRDSNHGECVQSCRWQWKITEGDRSLDVEQDERGTYLLNSKDLNMLSHLDKLIEAGVSSFKIEGRMKSSYYVATVVNAYRRAIDAYYSNEFNDDLVNMLQNEMVKASHRSYTTGFYFDNEEIRQSYDSAKAVSDVDFVAIVKGYNNGIVTVEMRNRFKTGDVLEVLTTGEYFNSLITVPTMYDVSGRELTDAKNVQQILTFACDVPLKPNDILRTIVKTKME